jgi:peptidoglycan-associated lipoprotein
MRLTRFTAALVASMLLLSACSTVKLDESASVETRKPTALSSADGSQSNSASAASNGSDTSASQSDASANLDVGAANKGSNSNASANGANTSADANANAKNAKNANAGNANDPLSDPSSILAKRSVYFDLDSYVVKDEYKTVMDAHGKYLASRPDRKVLIQGNTDERGGSEYNLALGQKRADAVRRALALRGVPESQMEAVSFGKEKPKAMGSNEEAWRENRRADIAY